MSREEFDAVVVGSGPNGLAAAITLAQAGRSVLVREAAPTIGGATRTAELTLPGFHHDVCSAAHPLAIASPFFRPLPLEKHGLRWLHSPAVVAQPLEGGRVALLRRSVDETAATLGIDGDRWRGVFGPIVDHWEELRHDILAPMVHVPRSPFRLAFFGLEALRSARGLCDAWFATDAARALFGGIAAHSSTPLESVASAAIGLVLGAAGHAGGWPIPAGGSQSIADALAAHLRSLGGVIEVNRPVESLVELPRSRWVFFDTVPRQVVKIAGERLSSSYRSTLGRFRHGAATFKLDWALSGPVPWKAKECALAATVHVGGTFDEMSASEAAPARGRTPERPYVLFGQPSLFDPRRAPPGKHTAWGYCHVPNGSTEDMTARVEAQIERFAPGFRDLILARSVLFPRDLEQRNRNLVGGDISGGSVDFAQILSRPTLFSPYRTSDPSLYLCSSSTPPGPGVHGMCGLLAARAALARG